MTKRIAGLTSVILLVLGIAAFTGSALAGNGTGTGKGNAKADSQTASANESASQAAPGNSTNAPGQIKQKTVSTQATGGGSAAQNAGVQAGAKPTSATAKGNKPTAKVKTQSGTFGGAIFKLTQAHNGLATLSIVEAAYKGAPSFATCKAPHKAAALCSARAKRRDRGWKGRRGIP